MSIIGELDAIVQAAMPGGVIRLPAGGPSIAAQCAFRLSRLGDETADIRSLLDIIEPEVQLCWADLLGDGVVNVLCTPAANLALVALEGAIGTLSRERQSSLFALAIVVWSIAEVKCGAVEDVSDYTPGLDRVLDSIRWLFGKDCQDADNRQIVAALDAAMRANVTTWQIKGRRNEEWAGE